MAKRIMKAQIKPVTCKLQIGVDYEITKPNLALTPQNIKDLTDRGMPLIFRMKNSSLKVILFPLLNLGTLNPYLNVLLICVNFGNLNKFPKIKCLRHIKLINVNSVNYG